VAGMTEFAESTKVISEPVEAAGKTIIPAVVVRVGLGAGGGLGGKKSEEAGQGEHGGGGGGGGMVTMTPVFLIVDSEGERLLTIPKEPGPVSSIVDSIRDIADAVTQARPAKKDEESEETQ